MTDCDGFFLKPTYIGQRACALSLESFLIECLNRQRKICQQLNINKKQRYSSP
jgi:hypothetical protein